jgi:hypothetical protein
MNNYLFKKCFLFVTIFVILPIVVNAQNLNP